MNTTMAGFPCAVRFDQECPFCYSDSPKLPLNARYEDTQNFIIPLELRARIMNLDVRCIGEKKQKELKEDSQSDDYFECDEFFDIDEKLRLQQQLATSHLETHRLKLSNQSLSKKVSELDRKIVETQAQHKEDHVALSDIVQELSVRIRAGDTSERKRKT